MFSRRASLGLLTTAAALLVLGVACGDESKHDDVGNGGSAGAVAAAGGSVAAAFGGMSASGGSGGASASAQGGSSEGGIDAGDAFGGSASGGAPQGGADTAGGAVASGGHAETNGGQAEATGGQAGSGGASMEAGAAGATFECTGGGEHFASSVRAYQFGSGQSFGQDKFPAPVLGPPRGGGCCSGSVDVTSLGDGGWVVLEFANNVIVDGTGADFIVFENAFVPSGGAPESVFAELGKVSVSQDGETWFAFPCASAGYPFTGCAGWHPVFANADTNSIDPTDPSVAGGDAFDLSDLGLAWVRYVRIDDVPEADGGNGTFDLDAVSIVHGGCP